ncbi:AaceriAGR108Cp [[Ashbya] aceris (nom. inval.)]|nr:AaceriAGR108Cp [[Ashbya] aceris (nom. inval.)]
MIRVEERSSCRSYVCDMKYHHYHHHPGQGPNMATDMQRVTEGGCAPRQASAEGIKGRTPPLGGGNLTRKRGARPKKDLQARDIASDSIGISPHSARRVLGAAGAPGDMTHEISHAAIAPPLQAEQVARNCRRPRSYFRRQSADKSAVSEVVAVQSDSRPAPTRRSRQAETRDELVEDRPRGGSVDAHEAPIAGNNCAERGAGASAKVVQRSTDVFMGTTNGPELHSAVHNRDPKEPGSLQELLSSGTRLANANVIFEKLKSYVRRLANAMHSELRLEYGLVSTLKLEQADNEDFDFRLQASKQELCSSTGKESHSFFISQAVILTTEHNEVWFTYITRHDYCEDTGIITLHLNRYSWAPPVKAYVASVSRPKAVLCSAQEGRVFRAMQKLCSTGAFSRLILNATIPRPKPPAKAPLSPGASSLNASQEAAYDHIHANKVSLIKGPPGTGKTALIVEMIKRTIKFPASCPVLCVAESNVAVDNIAERLLGEPAIRPIRICSNAKVAQYGSEHPLAPICLHTQVLKGLLPEQKLEYLLWLEGSYERFGLPSAQPLVSLFTSRSYAIVSSANVILTTNISAGSAVVKKLRRLPTVIMDEATQSPEASTLVPLSLHGIRKLVLVGDEMQLSPFALPPNFKTSLFNRAVKNTNGTALQFLRVQYRMHPAISEFPNQQFYNSRLVNGVTHEDRSWPDVRNPLIFVDLSGSAERRGPPKTSQEKSWCNPAEADFVFAAVHTLVCKKRVPPSQIGVITPYVAQRDAIASRLARDPVLGAHVTPREPGDQDSGQLLVASIDAFQGHERAFIIVSCVRANPHGQVGFLADGRRMNVALTRARNGLILVGNADTLVKGSRIWRNYIEYLRVRCLLRSSLADY